MRDRYGIKGWPRATTTFAWVFGRRARIGPATLLPAQSRIFAELLIDCEEDRTLRAVLVGMLVGMQR